MPPHRILFIDAYDSFSNSIISLLKSELKVPVESIKIDDQRFIRDDRAFFAFLDGFTAVVAGPGPGHPAKPADIGLIGKLWTLPDDHVLPVLGICLGFQSLCLGFGGKVVRLREPRHGIMAMISHCGKDVYSGSGKVIATQYHSLHVQLEEADGEVWEPSALWKPSSECPELLPLAWDLMGVVNGPVLMGVRHRSKPFWGVQYHPESICTNSEGHKLVAQWWEVASAWKPSRKRDSKQCDEVSDVASVEKTGSEAAKKLAGLPGRSVKWVKVDAQPVPSAESIVELFRNGCGSAEPLLLQSGTRNGRPVNPETGRFSIIGLQESSSMQIRYSTRSNALEIDHDGEVVTKLETGVGGAFAHIDDLMRSQRAGDGPVDSPFWGGLVGLVSYEAGLESIAVCPAEVPEDRPDIWFVFVERSIVVDHVKGAVYVQSIRLNDDAWIQRTKEDLASMLLLKHVPRLRICANLVDGPDMQEYCSKVRECQRQLRAGESYELCLTDQSTLRSVAAPWDLYRQLQDRNPAPFSAYLRLRSKQTQGISVAGSSPERFLSWSRQGKCQFRPIKGTVKKAPGVTRAKAEEILGSAKERAENLMIVDLIRHDLAGVAGVNSVRVPKLMSVEEYETVFQLVSVIEGDLDSNASGIAALAASLPPGSMTGAPKKRSCELLQEIEGGKPRGLYSGVIGYFDVGGAGDFSVVIRTAFKWDDEGDLWRIGAGGAITTLSEPEAEWEEMVTKRESVLNSLS